MMENEQTITKELALSRLRASMTKKRDCINRLENRMRNQYERKTGLSANYFFAM